MVAAGTGSGRIIFYYHEYSLYITIRKVRISIEYMRTGVPASGESTFIVQTTNYFVNLVSRYDQGFIYEQAHAA